MKWRDTVASRCRYSDSAEILFMHADILWESSLDDYQGDVHILARQPDGAYHLLEYSYGSCSECDDWDNRGLTTEEITAEMRKSLGIFKDKQHLFGYLVGLERQEAAFWQDENERAGSLAAAIRKELGLPELEGT